MIGQTLSMLYNYNHHVLRLNTEGLNHEDSLVQPAPGGNCLNWVLGHIMANRNAILRLLGDEPIWSSEKAAPYERGSKPLTDAAMSVRLPEILQDLDRSQERIQAGLGRLRDEDLEAGSGDTRLGAKLAFFQFHEAYHAGQVGLIRRLIGKEGIIR